MKKILLFITIFFLIFILFLEKKEEIKITEKIEKMEILNYSNTVIFDRKICGRKQKKAEKSKIIITPHHLHAKELMAEIFEKISEEKFEEIILIGPNHFEKGYRDIISGKIDAKIDGKSFKTNSENFNFFKNSDFYLEFNEKILIEDHAFFDILPFISCVNNLEIPLTTFLLKNKIADNSEKELLNSLLEISKNKKVLIIGSIDFSHYHNLQETIKFDEITKEAIKNRNLIKIRNFNSDNIDAPGVLAILIQLGEKNGLKMEQINHKNSFDFGGSPEFMTSYFTFIWE